ncbi:MAG: YidC/Oxa1 family membrane protein insertase [Defluviitaleaceae bacterium]|nr:YidC/Oxa1 family membrane protein insertase [Defluviitaleaceae bacterium]
MDFLFNNLPFLAQIQPEPGAIIGPIAFVFGHIIDFIMRGIMFISSSPVNALGFSIIIMTIIVRAGLVPSQLKMQQNAAKARAIKPEMDKIREKYGNTKDPELRRKMAAETQALNQKHGISLMSSCVPMLITMPIFFAIFAVFGRTFHFMPTMNEAYSNLAGVIAGLDISFHAEVLADIIREIIPQGMINEGFSGMQGLGNAPFYTRNIDDLNRAIHVLTPEHWEAIFYGLRHTDPQNYSLLRYYYDARMTIESFFGLNLVTPSGWTLPGIVIPILSAGTMAFSSWQMQKLNPATDPQQKMMQKMMLFVFPLLFGWFTVNAASAVGLYWTMGNFFLIAQNMVVLKFFPHKIGLVEAPEKGEKREKKDKWERDRDRDRK